MIFFSSGNRIHKLMVFLELPINCKKKQFSTAFVRCLPPWQILKVGCLVTAVHLLRKAKLLKPIFPRKHGERAKATPTP
jgi:hypothetical protein